MVKSEWIGVPKTSQAGKIRPLHSSMQQQQRAGVQRSWPNDRAEEDRSETRNCGRNLVLA